MPWWWNGRHGGLRSHWREPWEFESPLGHQQFNLARFVYRLGHIPFTDGRGVRFPYRVPT